MSTEPEDQTSLQLRVEETINLFKSQEWRQWMVHLSERRSFLQNQVNVFTRQADAVKAQIALALLDDVDYNLRLFRKKFSDAEAKLRSPKK